MILAGQKNNRKFRLKNKGFLVISFSGPTVLLTEKLGKVFFRTMTTASSPTSQERQAKSSVQNSTPVLGPLRAQACFSEAKGNHEIDINDITTDSHC